MTQDSPEMIELGLKLKRLEVATAELKLQGAVAAAVVPDLTKVTAGSLTVDAEKPMFGPMLATEALEQAVRQAVLKAAPTLEGKKVLVTTRTDLAAASLAYTDLLGGLDELIRRAVAALPAQAAELGQGLRSAMPLWPQIVATALPGVLSLLSAKRTAKGFDVAADSVAAAHRVAAALSESGVTILLDDFRIPAAAPGLQAKLDQVQAKRADLAGIAPASKEQAEVLGLIDAFLTRIAISDQGPSLYAEAVRWACLHEKDELHYVMLVNARPGSTAQSVDDRPLMMADRFSTVTTMGLMWTLIEAKTSQVKGGGAAEGVMALHGKIGSEIELGAVVSAVAGSASTVAPSRTFPQQWAAGS